MADFDPEKFFKKIRHQRVTPFDLCDTDRQTDGHTDRHTDGHNPPANTVLAQCRVDKIATFATNKFGHKKYYKDTTEIQVTNEQYYPTKGILLPLCRLS